MNTNGFALTEIVVAVAIAAVIFIAVFNFGSGIFSFNSRAQENLNAQSDGRRVLKEMVKELRSASPSSLGAYPIVAASSTSIIFFVNLDGDSHKERVRYFLNNNELKKGVIKPSGSPLTYNQTNEAVVTLVHNMGNGTDPIFEYFDSNYAGTTTPLVLPVQITSIRLVRITLKIKKDTASYAPVIVSSQVFMRNLKDNL